MVFSNTVKKPQKYKNNLNGENRHRDQRINVSARRITNNQSCCFKYGRLIDVNHFNQHDGVNGWTISYWTVTSGTDV